MSQNFRINAIPQQSVLVKSQDYVHRYFRSSLSEISGVNRLVVVHCLSQYAFTQNQLSGILSKSISTIRRDMQSADLLYEKSPNFCNLCKNMLSFINYYANYRTR